MAHRKLSHVTIHEIEAQCQNGIDEEGDENENQVVVQAVRQDEGGDYTENDDQVTSNE